MKNIKKYWWLILAAIITLIGFVTGWYFFLFLVFPLGMFSFGKKNNRD